MNADATSSTTSHRAWLRIEDFQLLVESGACVDFAKTELIDGEILCVNSQLQRHSYIKNEIGFLIRIAFENANGACQAIVPAASRLRGLAGSTTAWLWI